MNEKKMNAAEGIIKALELAGVTQMFGIPGGAIDGFSNALYGNDKISVLVTRHEAGAAYMADAYARLTGKIGVCFTTAGPGASNAVTGIATSFVDCVPVLIFTGQIATSLFGKGAFQGEVNIVNIFSHFTKYSRTMLNPDRSPGTVYKMIRTARSIPGGPVHLSLPMDMMQKEVSEAIEEPMEIRERLFDREGVREAASILLSARKPAIIAGWGVSLSRGAEELLNLAELLNIPVTTSPKAKGIFPESHPLSLGVSGFAGSPAAKEYFAEAGIDLVLAVGAGLNEMTTGSWNKDKPPWKIIQIDANIQKIGMNHPVSFGIVGDAASVLREMCFAVRREEGADADTKFLRGTPGDFQVERIKAKHASEETAPKSDSELYHPRDLIADIQKSFPKDSAFFADIGNVMTWTIRYMVIDKPYSFFTSLGFGGMGYATAAPVGAKLGAPDRPVVGLVGDSCFLMHGMEVSVASEHDIPAIWIVFNNAMHGMIYHGRKLCDPPILEGVPSHYKKRVDFAKTAEGLGAIGVKIEKAGGLTPELVHKVLALNRPVVFDIWIDGEATPPLGDRVKSVDKIFRD